MLMHIAQQICFKTRHKAYNEANVCSKPKQVRHRNKRCFSQVEINVENNAGYCVSNNKLMPIPTFVTSIVRPKSQS